jgi:hypothetical protein
MRPRPLALVGLLLAAAGCGRGAAGAPTHPPDGATVPDVIFQYRLLDRPSVPDSGREMVWYDPATGELRDASGIGSPVRQLVVANAHGATQTEWTTGRRPSTTRYVGDRRFLARMAAGGGAWLIRSYLTHHGGLGRLTVHRRGGRLQISSTTGRMTLTALVVRRIHPTAGLRRRLFTLEPVNVTDELRQVLPGRAPRWLAGAYWLGPVWHGLRADQAFVSSPVPRGRGGTVGYAVSYGGDRVDVSSGPPAGRALGKLANVLTRPRPCTLADGTPARVSVFRDAPRPRGLLGPQMTQALAWTRLVRITSAREDATVFAPARLAADLPAVCRALRPASAAR